MLDEKRDRYGSAKRRPSKLVGKQRDHELARLKLYRLAVQAVPWDGKESTGIYIPEALNGIEANFIKDDTWGTFMALEAAVPLGLVHWLPSLQDIETDEEIERNRTKQQSDEEQKNREDTHLEAPERGSPWLFFRRK